jgi:hypothetical protein
MVEFLMMMMEFTLFMTAFAALAAVWFLVAAVITAGAFKAWRHWNG